MIGLSPLSTGHPLRFQPKWVRPSTGSYPRFSLPMDSSPGFASAACDSIAILKARFHCGSVQTLTSPHTATRWLILQKARRHPARGLRLLVGARFQVLLRLGSNLNLAAYRNSLAHSTKGTPSPRSGAPTACRRTVSGTVSLPSRGAFHLSLTVLVRYRSQESVQPWRVVPPGSHRVSRARRYSGAALAVRADSRTGLSPCSAGLPRPFRFRADL